MTPSELEGFYIYSRCHSLTSTRVLISINRCTFWIGLQKLKFCSHKVAIEGIVVGYASLPVVFMLVPWSDDWLKFVQLTQMVYFPACYEDWITVGLDNECSGCTCRIASS